MSLATAPFRRPIRVAAASREAIRTALLAAAFVLAVSSRAQALQATDVAGTINGDPVPVSEVDRAAGGQASAAWRAIDSIERNAARALCVERIQQTLAQSEGGDLATWKARLWLATKPPGKQSGGATPAEHEAHVRAYRQRLVASAERFLAQELAVAVPTVPPGSAEPELPDVFAKCLGQSITRAEIESYAAYPLYERRAQLVSKLCEQFEISYEKPLVVEHVAAAEGKTLPQLLEQIEGDLGEVPDTEARRVASERFGSVDEASLAKARLALDGQRREDRKRAWLEKVRRETQAQCTLAMPPQPESDVRASGIAAGSPGTLPVYYFGDFECPNCGSGWQLLRSTAASYTGRVRVVFLHHFPDTEAELFSEALEAECAAQQGRFGEYGDWRTSPLRLGSVTDSLSLDAGRLRACMEDAHTAVSVLDDTAEALRLGFREAVPSWVVGRHVRRGLQGQTAIDGDIEQQLANPPRPAAPTASTGAAPKAPSPTPHATPAPAPPSTAGVDGSTKDARPSSSTSGAPASAAPPSAPAQERGATHEPGGGWR